MLPQITTSHAWMRRPFGNEDGGTTLLSDSDISGICDPSQTLEIPLICVLNSSFVGRLAGGIDFLLPAAVTTHLPNMVVMALIGLEVATLLPTTDVSHLAVSRYDVLVLILGVNESKKLSSQGKVQFRSNKRYEEDEKYEQEEQKKQEDQEDQEDQQEQEERDIAS
ncbi:hypothetical protein CAC42_3646 [Sphaceloma murrayae]|uniref:Uncharacterized protein n=1 Tax=Sphaceloma murrayae TaxID=2082308 RepID=A0A2K1QPQ0_9PEZI|nr:hypothetical protein CAC42_3646 [Sphaceloma murrayae]